MQITSPDVSHIYFGAASCFICAYSIVPLLVLMGTPAFLFKNTIENGAS